MEATATFACPVCGPTSLVVPDEPNEASPVSCEECGKVLCTYGQFEAKRTEIREQVRSAALGMLKGGLSG